MKKCKILHGTINVRSHDGLDTTIEFRKTILVANFTSKNMACVTAVVSCTDDKADDSAQWVYSY